MKALIPWQTSGEITLNSSQSADALMKIVMESMDFEGNVSPVDHFVRGSKPFVGCSNAAKNTFLVTHRHGNGLPLLARCAMGEIRSVPGGSSLTYRFTLRPWERFFTALCVILLIGFNVLALFSVIVSPSETEYRVLLGITMTLLFAAWSAPRICQWLFRGYEAEIAQLLKGVTCR
ncbi:MAG: hypothetical protein K2W95_33630 [Candidatus Obscuribacterales bacterium]|nr:hypothetical protein [Candidatus Obscuribacterales bacterium]